MASLPFPLASSSPRGANLKRLPRKSCVAWEMFTWPAAPDDSMRAAVFTVSPQTSYWNFFVADDARDDGARMHADAHAQVGAAAPPAFRDEVAHLERGLHDILGMRRVRHREAADGHVGVPDGLDLLHAALGDDDIEGVEAIVELAHEIGRRESGGELGEAFKVGEENGDARRSAAPRRGRAASIRRRSRPGGCCAADRRCGVFPDPARRCAR